MMSVRIIGLEPRGVAGPQCFFAVVGDEHELAAQHVDELVRTGVPVPLARPGARRETDEIDPELRQPRDIADARSLPRAARPVKGRRIEGADDRSYGLGVN